MFQPKTLSFFYLLLCSVIVCIIFCIVFYFSKNLLVKKKEGKIKTKCQLLSIIVYLKNVFRKKKGCKTCSVTNY